MSEGRKVEVLAAQGDAELAQIIYGRKDAGHVAPLQRRSRTKLRSAVRQRRAGAQSFRQQTRPQASRDFAHPNLRENTLTRPRAFVWQHAGHGQNAPLLPQADSAAGGPQARNNAQAGRPLTGLAWYPEGHRPDPPDATGSMPH